MCKPRHHTTTVTVRVNRLKLKIKQLRATRDELIAIANRLVELQEDLIAEKSKMEKVKDETLGQLEAELNEAKCQLNDSQVRHEEMMDQKDAEIARLADVVRHQDDVQQEMAAKMCKLEEELLSTRTEGLKAMTTEDASDSFPLESETTPDSDEAHIEATLDSNGDVTPHISFDDKTIICGKLETIAEGSEEACVHQPPPPRYGGRMPPPLVMQRTRLNSSREGDQDRRYRSSQRPCPRRSQATREDS
ncbi:hypothetical protein AC1031_010625 [Aphanomyces cochlioides]|nr:hypothetical protein AC1031_010625 [Aphanomyces cochlioides]